MFPSMRLLEGCFFFYPLLFDFTGYAARSSKAHLVLGRELIFFFYDPEYGLRKHTLPYIRIYG